VTHGNATLEHGPFRKIPSRLDAPRGGLADGGGCNAVLSSGYGGTLKKHE